LGRLLALLTPGLPTSLLLRRLATALEQPFPDRLQFVLGTESGMITSIVLKVQGMLRAAQRDDVAVEIVFPVSPEAITTDKQQQQAELPGGLSVVPGPAGGEGCSLEGGCASCPYMKMNSLAALMGGEAGGRAVRC
jgi:quinolinate synthase